MTDMAGLAAETRASGAVRRLADAYEAAAAEGFARCGGRPRAGEMTAGQAAAKALGLATAEPVLRALRLMNHGDLRLTRRAARMAPPCGGAPARGRRLPDAAAFAQGWHVAMSAPRRETAAANWLEERGMACYVPMAQSYAVCGRPRRRQVALHPLWPGYLLLAARPGLDWAMVDGCGDVAGVLRQDGRPAILAADVVQRVALCEDGGGFDAPEPRPVRRGDRVRVIAGAFRGAMMQVERVAPGRFVEGVMRVFGGATAVRVAIDGVDAAA